MIDYFFRFTDEAEAKQDALMLADHLGVEITPGVREWMRDHVLPNVKAWRPSLDTVVEGQVVHQYITGWLALVSLNRHVQVLLDATPLQFALDRDACNAGQPFVVKNNIGALLQDIAVSPIFAGSNYPVGGYT